MFLKLYAKFCSLESKYNINITQFLNHRLGLTEIGLPGAQPVTVATAQSHQLTTNIPNHLPNSIATGQQDDYDYQDNMKEELYQVDGTMDLRTLTIQIMMKIMSQIIMHLKEKERYMPQLIELEKT